MRRRVVSGLAVFLALAAVFLALATSLPALAGENLYLGTIFVYDGGTSNNCETTTRAAGREWDGGTISDGGSTDFLYTNAGFALPASYSGQPVTQVCATDVRTLTGVRGCDAGRCPPWYATQWLPTTLTPITAYSYTAYTGALFFDAGLAFTTNTCSGGLIAISVAPGNSYAECQIYGRSGNE